jgi:acyl-CoA synthetase (NDP forming)/GNAT superfamily N-acetyltransferase
MTPTAEQQRTVDVALRDGAIVRVRPVRADDEAALRAFLDALPVDDRALRYFSAGVNLSAAAHDAATVDGVDRYGLVAVSPGEDDGPILAHGCFVRSARDTAEIAFTVAPELRGEGVATVLLAHLARAAQEVGIDHLTAVVLPENRAMLDVFRESGLVPTVRVGPGELHVTMPARLDAAARAAFDRRDAAIAAAAVAHVLRPASVAVVGASDRPGSVGGAVLRNLVQGGFAGAVHVVNRRSPVVGGRPAHPTLSAVGAPIELVVVAVPAAEVVAVAEAAGEIGARALVVLADGFGEAGTEGRDREARLLGVCRRHGMRLVGPNCLGVVNTDPQVRLHASFAPRQPAAGRLAFFSQSGALAIAAIDVAAELGTGFSSLVSIGDKADLSGNDFLNFWEQDPRTSAVLLYVESFGNPRAFSRVACRVARGKPIVAVKGGRSAAGRRAAGSHTGALLGGGDATVVDALFHQAGVIAVDSLGELVETGALLAAQPAPTGPRVGIVTNGGGLGILCADACAAAGLDVVELSADARAGLASVLPPGSAPANPVDLLAQAPPEAFERALAALAGSGEVDALIALYVPPMVSDPEQVAAAIRRAVDAIDLPVAAVFTMARPPQEALGPALPAYRLPETAARAMGRAARHGAWRARPLDVPAEIPAADHDAAAAAIAQGLGEGAGWLRPEHVAAILDAYGIPRPDHRIVRRPTDAARAALELRGSVALKAIAAGLVHRSDVGAVQVGISGASAVAREARAMRRRLADAGVPVEGFLVQAMASPGVELLLGVVDDPTFGPVVACAAGGATTEILRDSAVRLTPLSERDAAEQLRELRSFPLLDGFRGSARCDLAAVQGVLVRLAALADRHPAIAELEINPLMVTPRGVQAVDTRIRVRVPPPPAPGPALRGAAWPVPNPRHQETR